MHNFAIARLYIHKISITCYAQFMGNIEHSLQKEMRRTRINSAIISTLAVGGVVAVSLIAPGVIGAMGKLGLINPFQKRQSVKKSLSRLILQGYISMKNGKVQLTQKGEKFAAMIGEGGLIQKKPKRWDGKWRMLIFDIPERKKNIREYIRTTLVSLGFYRLQDSVWVHPYDSEDFITILKVDLKIGKDVLYIIADRIEYDAPLRKYFKLL